MTLADEIKTRRIIGPVTRTDFVRYAGAGGDFNPLHHDDEYAKGLGLPSVFAMGMWTAGLLAAFLSDQLGPNVRALDVRFRSPVWPGDELSITLGESDAEGGRPVAVTAGGEPRVTGLVWTDSDGPAPASVTTPSTDRLTAIAATEFGEVSFPVERGKVIEFARAVHANSPLHQDVSAAHAAGFADVVAPLTFGNALAHWSGGDATEVPIRLGLELSRVVHGEQRYRFVRPMIAGEVLLARRRVSDVVAKPARSGGEMTLVTVVTDFIDETGSLVLAEEMVMIEQPPKSAV